MAEEQVNERLKQALRNAGMEIDDLAAKVEVDIRTAYRWLTAGRTPYPRHRRRVADALGVPEQTLWPSEAPGNESAEPDATGELVEVFTDAADSLDWRELIAGTSERVCLLDLTLADVLTDPEDARLLAAAGARGCRVQVIVSHRDSVHLALADSDLQQPASLLEPATSARSLERVMELLLPHLQQGQIELRAFVGHGAYRVLMFDDQALVTLRIPGIRADALPLLCLSGPNGIFDRFARHFDAVWQSAESIH